VKAGPSGEAIPRTAFCLMSSMNSRYFLSRAAALGEGETRYALFIVKVLEWESGLS
jgi:hypothetical protein